VSVDAEPFADRFPSYLTRFVGREREIAELEAMLEPRGLITICGVGGLGKTRLAIEVARRFSEAEKPPTNEAFWVPLTGTRPTELPLAGLAVFVGGFTREAAEAVTGASLTSLATLVERSLI
jgi:hypothetical protein